MGNMIKHKFESFNDFIARAYADEITFPESNDGIIGSQSFTFQVTDNCNLACTYCYQICKGKNRMPIDIAKKAVDNILTGANGFDNYIDINSPAITLEFIGGEPLLEVELIDEIVDYFIEKALMLDHKWAYRFAINISTNGVLYNDTRVQKFLQKHRNRISLSVTVDGTKELHDTCRVFPDGSPSYDLAHHAAMDWMSRGNYMGSKITIAPENITYLSECLLKMIDDGYDDINANVVYEDVWKQEHATELYNQIKIFSDTIADKNINIFDYAISLLSDTSGHPQLDKDNHNYCGGTGLMLSMDWKGDLYPCIRYMESSLGGDQKPLKIGSIEEGLGIKPEHEKCIKCLKCITRRSQSTDQCYYCPISAGCGWCSAYNYQATGDVNKRAITICEMHKARILGTVYFWNTYYKHNNIKDVMDLWVPKSWAINIISEQEYEELVQLTKELGGHVNYTEEMLKLTEQEYLKLTHGKGDE